MATAEKRLKEADDIKGLNAIVSACPFCELQLKDGIKQSNRKIEVMDIMELLLKSLS